MFRKALPGTKRQKEKERSVFVAPLLGINVDTGLICFVSIVRSQLTLWRTIVLNQRDVKQRLSASPQMICLNSNLLTPGFS